MHSNSKIAVLLLFFPVSPRARCVRDKPSTHRGRVKYKRARGEALYSSSPHLYYSSSQHPYYSSSPHLYYSSSPHLYYSSSPHLYCAYTKSKRKGTLFQRGCCWSHGRTFSLCCWHALLAAGMLLTCTKSKRRSTLFQVCCYCRGACQQHVSS
jgi:hypothetical protein